MSHSNKLLLLLCCLGFARGGVAQQTSNPGPLSKAESSLDEARKTQSDPRIALGHYLDAADEALRVMNGAAGGEAADARLTYNQACQEIAILSRSNSQLWNQTETIRSQDHIYRFHIAGSSREAGTWDPGYFDFFRTPTQLHQKNSSGAEPANGWGGALVGVHKSLDPAKNFLPPTGLAVPVTAEVDFTKGRANARDVRDGTLGLYDPTRRQVIRVAGVQRPMAADFSAPFAYYPNPGLFLGIAAMMSPEKYLKRAGLYMLDPYDPDRIPVVFVHGLISLPRMWVPTINAIESDPELRRRFQFWIFAYPTGDPIMLNALRLRESLERIYQLYPKTKRMVLISHSMGGLLSRMQATSSGRVLWNGVFKQDADRFYASLPPDNLVKKALVFDANPRVQRIVFICVPHRGSDLATNWLGSIGVGLTRLPSTLVKEAGSGVAATFQKNAGLTHMPTGVNGLSPRSPVLRSLDALPVAVPYHSIIGDRGRGDTPNSSDGVVAYWSSHLDGAQSELIVPGPHGSFALPQTIAELKRILRLHLASLGDSRSKDAARKAPLAHRPSSPAVANK